MVNLIKIGGSVITNKNKVNSFDKFSAQKIAKFIPKGAIIVHGSGSFGKPAAVELDYLNGIVEYKKIPYITHVRKGLSQLNSEFTALLSAPGRAVLGVSATALFASEARSEVRFTGSHFINNCLSSKIVPVIHSDFILHTDSSLRVLSSDEIVCLLAKHLKPDNIVFATDVDGVLVTKNNKILKKKIFPVINYSTFDKVDRTVCRTKNDLTGGMKDKILFALKSKKYSENVIILNGNKAKRMYLFCNGNKKVKGTLLEF